MPTRAPRLAIENPPGAVELQSGRIAHPAQGAQGQGGTDGGVAREPQGRRRPGGPVRGPAGRGPEQLERSFRLASLAWEKASRLWRRQLATNAGSGAWRPPPSPGMWRPPMA